MRRALNSATFVSPSHLRCLQDQSGTRGWRLLGEIHRGWQFLIRSFPRQGCQSVDMWLQRPSHTRRRKANITRVWAEIQMNDTSAFEKAAGDHKHSSRRMILLMTVTVSLILLGQGKAANVKVVRIPGGQTVTLWIGVNAKGKVYLLHTYPDQALHSKHHDPLFLQCFHVQIQFRWYPGPLAPQRNLLPQHYRLVCEAYRPALLKQTMDSNNMNQPG